MDTGADAMPVSDRLRLRWPSPEAASGVEDPWASEDDVALVGRVTVGDAAALTALYRRHADRLFAFLQQYARDRMVAEELLQDTLLAVWRSAPLYAGRSSVRTWMFGIARRQAHNRLRVQEPQKLPLDGLVGWADPAPGPAEWAIASAQRSPTHSPRSPHTTVRCWRWRSRPGCRTGRSRRSWMCRWGR